MCWHTDSARCVHSHMSIADRHGYKDVGVVAQFSPRAAARQQLALIGRLLRRMLRRRAAASPGRCSTLHLHSRSAVFAPCRVQKISSHGVCTASERAGRRWPRTSRRLQVRIAVRTDRNCRHRRGACSSGERRCATGGRRPSALGGTGGAAGDVWAVS